MLIRTNAVTISTAAGASETRREEADRLHAADHLLGIERAPELPGRPTGVAAGLGAERVRRRRRHGRRRALTADRFGVGIVAASRRGGGAVPAPTATATAATTTRRDDGRTAVVGLVGRPHSSPPIRRSRPRQSVEGSAGGRR